MVIICSNSSGTGMSSGTGIRDMYTELYAKYSLSLPPIR